MLPQNKNTDLKYHLSMLTAVAIFFIWSLVNCVDLYTWLFVSVPIIIATALIIFFYRIIKLTNICYVLITIHAIILLIAAHYTSDQVPIFNSLRDTFQLSRNHYDRFAYFAQGFAPAIVIREVLMLATPLKKGKSLAFITVSICLAITSVYQILQWLLAEINSTATDASLTTQADLWHSQKEITLCLLGAILSLVILTKLHDKQLKKNFIYRLKKGFA